MAENEEKTFLTGEEGEQKEEEETEEQKAKRLEEEEQQRVEDEKARKRQEQAVLFEKYIEESGLSVAFQIVFAEIISKKIAEDQVFRYTAMRLRQLGKEVEDLEPKPEA